MESSRARPTTGPTAFSWLFSFLTADKRWSYCLYEAPSPDAIVDAARRANVPVDSIVEVSRLVPAELLAQ